MSNDGMLRMNLAGLEPELRQRIKALAEMTIRTFDGAPEHYHEWHEATRLWQALRDLEATGG